MKAGSQINDKKWIIQQMWLGKNEFVGKEKIKLGPQLNYIFK